MRTTLRRIFISPVLLLTITLTLLPTAAGAKDREFSPITKYLKTQYQARQRHGFWLGLAGMAVKMIRPAGVKSFKLAFFESLNLAGDTHGAGLNSAMRSALSREWQPLVRVSSNQRSEKQGFVYARQDGKDFKLMIVALDNNQAFVVRVKINPETMMKWMEKPEILGIDLGGGKQNNERKEAEEAKNDIGNNKNVKLEKQDSSEQP